MAIFKTSTIAATTVYGRDPNKPRQKTPKRVTKTETSKTITDIWSMSALI